MSDQFNPFAGFFFANGPGVNLKLREKIALAQMMQKRKAPSTFGEGLSAIGDSLGDIGTARRLEEQDRLSQQAAMQLGTTPGAISGTAVPPPPGPQAGATPQSPMDPTPVPSTVQEGAPPAPPQPLYRPGVSRSAAAPPAQPLPPAAPAVPLPPDQQQSYEPGAPVRMSTDAQIADFRAQNPLPPGLPPVPQGPPAVPQQPGGARPTVADFGQKLALAPTDPNASPLDNMPWPHGNVGAPPQPGVPPVMAQGGDDPRTAIALSMLRQGQTGQPQMSQFAPASPGAPPPPAAPPPSAAARGVEPPPPDQGIAAAPPAAPIQKMPAPPPAAGVYTPPMPGTPQGAPIIGPTRREMELQTLLNANQTNPYATSSPAAIELKQLQDARTRRQNEADELFKAQVARDTKQVELHHTGRMDEQKREQELRKGRQELIDGGTAPAGAEDPRLLGTPQSPQRTGVPRPDPMPPGVIPQDWAKDQQKKMSAAADNLEAAKPELSEALDLMKKIRAHPGKDRSIGFGGAVGRMTPTGQGFAALDEQLKGKNLVAAYQKVRGTGPVGQVEGENIAKAQAALTTAATKEDYDAALNTLEGTMRGALERAERKMNRPVTAYQNSPDDPHAPDIGQPSPGGTKIYIGGDPAKPTSWKNR